MQKNGMEITYCEYCNRMAVFPAETCNGCGAIVSYEYGTPRWVQEKIVNPIMPKIMADPLVPHVMAMQTGCVTADDFINQVFHVVPKYRRSGIMVTNDRSEMAFQQLKDGKGQYLWQPSVQPDERPNTFLGNPIYQYDMPDIPIFSDKVGVDVCVFGDLKSYEKGVKEAVYKLRVDGYR